MATSALPLTILRNGLTHCYYLSLHCRRCGNVRAAVEEVPSDRFHPCPLCHRDCVYAILGEGGTQRALPFWNQIRESVSLDNQWLLQKARASA
jgi:hypothetical protein